MSADGSILIDTSIDGKGFQSGLEKISSSAKTALGSLAGFVGIGATVGGAITYVTKTGMDFEAQMSRVAAISGATGNEFDALTNQAKQLGANTAFSSTQAAEGMENLASAGFSTKEIMEAMPGMLDLAASSGEDLASSSDIAASTLRGFGLAASDAGHVADVLAKNAADTNAAVMDTGYAMKYVAPVARTAGWSFESVTAAIGEMANAGIKGEQAGTTLRGALTRLMKPSKAMSDAMDAIGFSVYDASGKMKPLSQIIDELNKKTAGMTEQQKNATIATIFGTESLSGMQVLLQQGGSNLDKMTDSLKNSSGAADEMAKTMQGNLKGAVEQLGGSFESLAINFYQNMSGSLTEITKRFTEFVNSISAHLPEIASTIETITASFVAFKVAVLATKAPILALNAAEEIQNAILAAQAIQTLGAKGAMELFAGETKNATIAQWLLNAAQKASPVGIAIGLIAALVAGIVVLWNTNEGFRDAVLSIWGAIVGFFTDTIPSAWNGLMELFNGIPDWWNGLWTQVGQFFTDCWNGIISFFTDTIPAWIASVGEWFQQIPYNIGLALGTAAKAVVDFGANIWNWVTTELPKIIQGIINWFAQLPGKIWAFLVQVVTNISTWGTNMWNYLSVQIPKIINGIGTWFSQLPGKIWGFLTTVISNIGTWGKDMLQKAGQAAKDTATSVVNGFKALPQNMLNIGKNIVTGLWNGIKSSAKWLWDKVTGFCDDIVDGFKKGFGIHSPSKLMSDEIGRFLPPGITVGMDKAMPSTILDMKSQLADMMAQARATIADEQARFGATFAARPNYQVALAGGYGTASTPAEPYTGPNTVEAHISINDREFAVATAPAIGKQLGWKGGK